MTPDQIVLTYQQQYERLRLTVAAQLAALWVGLGGVTDRDANRFVTAAAPAVRGAQLAVARLVAGYFAAVTCEVLGSARTASIPPSSVTTTELRGVDFADVYQRPVVTARTALSQHRPYDVAMDLAAQRLSQIVTADVVMAQRAATVAAVDNDERIVGYSRVLTGNSCALCATASSQRYHRGDLMPIHAHCDCSVAPIYGNADPGHIINQKLIDDLKAAARQTGDSDYWRNRRVHVAADGTVALTRPAVQIHGELGPVLTDPDHDFTGADDIAA